METPKRILAIETSGRLGSAALLTGHAGSAETIAQFHVSTEQRTAQALAPGMQRLLAGAEWPAKSVDLVAVAVGPGSFTGLRIGVTTAKTFAYAVGAEIIGVNTLAVIAAQAPPTSQTLWTILDAQRQELFVSKFAANPAGDVLMMEDTSILSQHSWIAQLSPGDHVTGPALKRLASQLPSDVTVASENVWQPRATTVGQVARKAYQYGQRDDVWKLLPSYYRPSAAEEKLR